MYEKLDKLRAEVKRWEQRIEDDKAKLRIAQEKLEKAESEQILADVGALKLKPEQLAEFLKLATSGKTLLVITHDPEFILNSCQSVIRMEHGKVVEQYPLLGNEKQLVKAMVK